ncbi:MAG: leucine-rich repeat domain-containing protein [Oscillospiraceae bacterium]|nr:leucine-rich repeat domain-containing protein [Oscillospiraceae bacterium]
MDDRIIEVLLEIKNIHNYGGTIFENKKRLNNILKDLLTGEIKYELCIGKINALMYAIDEHTHENIAQHKDNPSKTQKHYINLLKRKYSINDEAASFAVNAVSVVIGIEPPEPRKTRKTRKIKAPKIRVKRIKPVKPVKQIKTKRKIKKKSIILFAVLAVILISAAAVVLYFIGLPPVDLFVVFNDDGTAAVTGYEGKERHIEIPAVIENRSVTAIGDFAFIDCVELTSITIPDRVIYIGEHAFEGTGLISAVIPDSVGVISDFTFYQCIDLIDITIPGSVTEIGNQAFAGCVGLTDITIPESVTYIHEFAFWGCLSLSAETKDRILQINPDAKFGL